MLRDEVIELFVKLGGFYNESRPILGEKPIEYSKQGNRNKKPVSVKVKLSTSWIFSVPANLPISSLFKFIVHLPISMIFTLDQSFTIDLLSFSLCVPSP